MICFVSEVAVTNVIFKKKKCFLWFVQLHYATLVISIMQFCSIPDSSKFGQRILEKMGWAPGKGLGADESGPVNPVHVKYKWDNKGLC